MSSSRTVILGSDICPSVVNTVIRSIFLSYKAWYFKPLSISTAFLNFNLYASISALYPSSLSKKSYSAPNTNFPEYFARSLKVLILYCFAKSDLIPRLYVLLNPNIPFHVNLYLLLYSSSSCLNFSFV